MTDVESPLLIVDAGLGNVGSVLNMIRRVGGKGEVTRSNDQIASARKLILPGIGSFDAGMTALTDGGFDSAINHAVAENGAILLGICLGMQLLLAGSEEGTMPGLGLVPGKAKRFRVAEQGLRVPHMAWNAVEPTRSSALFDRAEGKQRFYFVHSYYVEVDDASDTVGTTHYGHGFTSAFERDRIYGVQFHPEKSHRYGMGLLKRFLTLPPS